MTTHIPALWLRLLLILLLPCAAVASEPWEWSDVESCRPWAYNWWLGNAVDQANLSRELQRYRQGGLGGVHIVPIYGAKGAEDRYIDYLTPEWLAMLDFAIREGQRLGVGIDMTTGTGWCFGGPHIPRELGCRNRVLKQIPYPENGRLPSDLAPDRVSLQAVIAQGPEGQQETITERIRPDGSLDWSPPGKDWSLLVLGHQFANRMVKRASPGGAGPMINPFSPAAMRAYLEPFTTAFANPQQLRPRAMYHDSFEYSGNWSPELPDQFARRRGYRIEDHLAALAGQGDPDGVARVRCDVAETLSDLVIEDVFPQWTAWCRERGILTRNQAHGAPANWLDFYALADIPETEMFGHGGPDPLVSEFDENIGGADRDPLISKFASSAAHTAGKSLTSSETGTWLAEHFCETLEELKCEIDLFFLAGVNHIIYHGCVYSPDDATWPGWLFYASTQMNPRNPLWREATALNQYVARCQSVLRTGQPDNDVLLYWPIHDAWSAGIGNMSVHNKLALEGPLGPVARLLWQRGYGFDYVSDRLLAGMQVESQSICGPKGVRWQAIVVPRCQQMPPATLSKLIELAEAGATVVFEQDLPRDVPGLGCLKERRAALQPSLVKLEISGSGNQITCGQGRVFVGAIDESLRAANVTRESLADHSGLRFIRRRHDGGRHYFLAQHGVEPLDAWIPLATPAQSVVILDPLTGRTGVADVKNTADGKLTVRLRLEPGHSIILRTFEQETIEGPAWNELESGKTIAGLDGPWQIEFIAGGPELPRAAEIKSLVSWTTLDDPTAQAFAGTARYRTVFDLAANGNPDAITSQILDLGQVKHIARVKLNGQDLGVRFMDPYRYRIPAGRLRAQGNELEVEVTNLAANRIRDLDRRQIPWRNFHDANVVNINYRPFDASNWPLADSGLLGPVTIRAE